MMSAQPGISGGGLQQARDQFYSSGFAGGIGPEKSEKLPGLDIQIESLQGLQAAVVHGEVTGADHGVVVGSGRISLKEVGVSSWTISPVFSTHNRKPGWPVRPSLRTNP